MWEYHTPVDINKNKVSLTDIKILFTNVDKFNKMPLNEDKANTFVKHRKATNGNVDRTIKMVIYFTIDGLKHDAPEKWKDITLHDENILVCDIKRIDFFEDGWPSWNWLTSVGR